MTFKLDEISRDSHKLVIPALKAGEKFTAFVQADTHWDSLHCDRSLLKRHMEQAVALNAPIFIFGDFFDAMQGKWDKRANQEMLRPEHRGNNYLDLLVKTAAEWLKPYAQHIALITPGNHEDSIEQRHETNLTERLCERVGCKMGAFAGFVRIARKDGVSNALSLSYHHGYGGGGEVTRGMIDHSRTRSQAMADIFISGHIHRRNFDENIILSLNHDGTIHRHRQLFIRCASYKDDDLDQRYHVARGRGPRPKGGWFLHFSEARGGNGSHQLICTPEPAS